jgi:hypothetical protein
MATPAGSQPKLLELAVGILCEQNQHGAMLRCQSLGNAAVPAVWLVLEINNARTECARCTRDQDKAAGGVLHSSQSHGGLQHNT